MKNKPTPFLTGLLFSLLVCLSGCVSSASFEDLQKKFATYVETDRQQLKASTAFIDNEVSKIDDEEPMPLRLKLQRMRLKSWKAKQDRASDYLKGLNQ